jgi:hypothetical protein
MCSSASGKQPTVSFCPVRSNADVSRQDRFAAPAYRTGLLDSVLYVPEPLL